ncbi:MAG: hypothetical protein AAGB46_07390, partial [Verrucomicrobiota bacterium]
SVGRMKKKSKIALIAILIIFFAATFRIQIAFFQLGSAWVSSAFDGMIYENQDSFLSEEWKEGNKKTRYSFVDALLASNPVKNKSKDQVREILGDPDQIEDGTIWHYETKRPGWRFIDFSGGGISVKFNENNQVKGLSDTRWID